MKLFPRKAQLTQFIKTLDVGSSIPSWAINCFLIEAQILSRLKFKTLQINNWFLTSEAQQFKTFLRRTINHKCRSTSSSLNITQIFDFNKILSGIWVENDHWMILYSTVVLFFFFQKIKFHLKSHQ